MKTVRVGAAALNQIPLDFQGNKRRIAEAIEEARQREVEVLCLPELSISGYGCEDMFLAPSTHERSLKTALDLESLTRGMIVAVGLPLFVRGTLYNACAVYADGELLGFVAKQHLAGDGIHYEPRWFAPWPANYAMRFEVGDRTFPVGDLRFELGGIRLGLEICEDAWIAERPGIALAEDGIDIVLNPSASHFAFGKRDTRERIVREGSRAFGCAYVYSNLLGNESGRVVYDGHLLVAEGGNVIAEGSRFSFAETKCIDALVDVSALRAKRSAWSANRPKPQDENIWVKKVFAFRNEWKPRSLETRLAWENSEHLKEEEFARAVSLGLFDYQRKSFSQGFVVSLSGGADSSAVSLLCHWSLRLAILELGAETVRTRLAHLKLESVDTRLDAAHRWTHNYLTTAYQGTAQSGKVTREAASKLGEALNSRHLEWEVDELVNGYIQLAEKAEDRLLEWKRDDLALQNIQARTRGPSVWMLANIEGKLLLSTSNRSEAAVGYATMDGDTCGGLSPIAGIDKAYLRKWLVWAEQTGPEGVGPTPALGYVNRQQPTAELRPSSMKQTDEADLMPYEILDRIERCVVRDKRDLTDTFAILQIEWPEIEAKTLLHYLERFALLFARNQWKRERYAPSFHVDDESLDPKTFFRFPILSAGFSEELRELQSL